MADAIAPGSAAIAATVIRDAVESTPAAYAERPRTGFGSAWIRSLCRAFQEIYPEPQFKCFAKGIDSRFRTGAGRKKTAEEILYDITVVEWGNLVKAPLPRSKPIYLPVLGRPVWQVESEINVDSRAVAYDFGKLLQGSAENKLLITRERDRRWEGEFLEFLRGTSRGCTGRLFIGFIQPYVEDGPCRQGSTITLRGLWRMEAGCMIPLVAAFPAWPQAPVTP